MKILLDHNTPLGVRRLLANHDVHPAGQIGWAKHRLSAKPRDRRIAVVALMTNRWNDIRAQPQTLHHAVDNAASGTVTAARFLPRRGSRPPSAG